MKKALVLGVGSAQVDLIRYLKSDGWWVMGCSYQQNGPGLRYVDKFYLVDITNHTELVKICKKEQVDLIYSIGSDLAMLAIAIVAPQTNLPNYIPKKTAELLHNKAKLRWFLSENEISHVEFKEVKKPTDLVGWSHFPAIVKPVDNQGQRGVFVAKSLPEIEAGFQRTLNFSKSKTIIVEEYLHGPEISVHVFLIDSRIVFGLISDRIILAGYSGGIAKGHIVPTKICTAKNIDKIYQLINKCINALEIENGPLYFQIILTNSGPRVIEITARLDGCQMWRLIRSASGVDLLDASVRQISGKEQLMNLTKPAKIKQYRLSFHLSPPNKGFNRLDYLTPPEACYQEMFYTDGELIRPVNGFMEKVGYYIEPDPLPFFELPNLHFKMQKMDLVD